jgi:diamine N-acetyltransferase
MITNFPADKALSIRYGRAEDNVLLADLGARTFFDAFAADNKAENMAAYIASAFYPSKQAEELADPKSVFLIAEIAGNAVGYARLLAGEAPAGVGGIRPIEMVRIYAEQSWIGHGIGSALMQACLDEARQRGHDILWLGVWEHNPRAIAFYHKWGFAEAGTQTFQLGDELQNDLLMKRDL